MGPDVSSDIPEVLRTWKRRVERPGEEASQQELTTWKSRLRAFFGNDKPGSAAQSKTKAGIPMLANRICAEGLDHALLGGCQTGLAKYQAEPLILIGDTTYTRYFVDKADLPPALCADGEDRRACLLEVGTEKRVLELPKSVRPELHMMSDCGSVGFAMGLWLYTRGRCRGSFSTDVFAHDTHNSVQGAIVASGLWLVVLEVALVLNFTCGPFGSDANWEDLKSASLDCYAFMDTDDQMFDTFYYPIARDLNKLAIDEMHTAEHKSMVKDMSQVCKGLRTKGDKVKLSRWFSVFDRWHEKLVE